MAGLIEHVRLRAAEDPGFDPGKPGQPSATYSFVSRMLNLLARSFMVEKPDALRKLTGFLIVYFANSENVATNPLTPQEATELKRKFLRTPEPEIEDSPHSPDSQEE